MGKIRLRKPSEHLPIPQNGRSLSSILAEIVRRPPPSQQNVSKKFQEYKLPQDDDTKPPQNLFSTSLSKSISTLAKFADLETCRDIIEDVVERVEESNKICGGIIGEVIDDIFFQEECCAILLDNIVDQVVDDVESLKEILEKHRIETEEEEFLRNLSEDQKMNANLTNDIEKNRDNDIAVTGNDHHDDVIKDVAKKHDSDESSIELSDSDFELDPIEEEIQKPVEIIDEITKNDIVDKDIPVVNPTTVPNLVIKKSQIKTKAALKSMRKKKT